MQRCIQRGMQRCIQRDMGTSVYAEVYSKWVCRGVFREVCRGVAHSCFTTGPPPQVTTSQGKGRAFIRRCLSEHLLAECIQTTVSDVKKTR